MGGTLREFGRGTKGLPAGLIVGSRRDKGGDGARVPRGCARCAMRCGVTSAGRWVSVRLREFVSCDGAASFLSNSYLKKG